MNVLDINRSILRMHIATIEAKHPSDCCRAAALATSLRQRSGLSGGKAAWT
jgi:hypothetical protein